MDGVRITDQVKGFDSRLGERVCSIPAQLGRDESAWILWENSPVWKLTRGSRILGWAPRYRQGEVSSRRALSEVPSCRRGIQREQAGSFSFVQSSELGCM